VRLAGLLRELVSAYRRRDAGWLHDWRVRLTAALGMGLLLPLFGFVVYFVAAPSSKSGSISAVHARHDIERKAIHDTYKAERDAIEDTFRRTSAPSALKQAEKDLQAKLKENNRLRDRELNSLTRNSTIGERVRIKEKYDAERDAIEAEYVRALSKPKDNRNAALKQAEKDREVKLQENDRQRERELDSLRRTRSVADSRASTLGFGAVLVGLVLLVAACWFWRKSRKEAAAGQVTTLIQQITDEYPQVVEHWGGPAVLDRADTVERLLSDVER
jgi:hypothetical protein